LAKTIIKMTNSNSEIEFIPYENVYGKNFEDMKARQPALDKIKKAINFKYEFDIEDILRDVIDYFKK
jgi:UDP-glucose 4-epimerase